jgi:glycosyltransferase involved in cell wall biosynthesis
MKIIHIPFCFFPDAVGGTEVYVDGLAREQQTFGDRVIVAAPGERDARYSLRGLRVRRFAIGSASTDAREVYSQDNDVAARHFGRLLDDEGDIDLVHLHALSSGVSPKLVYEAKCRGLPVVFSYHTPTVSCARGTLLRWGVEPCDGTLHVGDCAGCTLHGLGLPRLASSCIAHMPQSIGRVMGNRRLGGRCWTALRMTELIGLRHRAVRNLWNDVDHVVALCDWTRDLLLRNGLPEDKVTVSRQGLCRFRGIMAPPEGEPPASGLPIRAAYAGRLNPHKGVHILIEALRRIPTAPLHLDIYGIAQASSDWAYKAGLETLAEGDSRICFRNPLQSDQVVGMLRQYDFLAVPSRWLETGPMVILEAFAAGVPVIGSNLGGIAELVTENVDGLLVGRSAEAWRQLFRRICDEPGLVRALRPGVQPPRTIREAAVEMRQLYKQILGRSAAVCSTHVDLPTVATNWNAANEGSIPL